MANIIVLFEVRPTHAGMKKYLDLAAMLKPMFAGFEGFIRAERFSSLKRTAMKSQSLCLVTVLWGQMAALPDMQAV